MKQIFYILLMVLYSLGARCAPADIPLSKEFCAQFLTTHQSDADVAYKAGVDVDGKPIESADMNAVSVPLPKVIRIPITIQKKNMLQIQTSGTSQSSGVLNQSLSGTTQATGQSGMTSKQIQMSAFISTLPNVAATVATLTPQQLTTFNSLLARPALSTATIASVVANDPISTTPTTSTGTVLGSSTGTTNSTGTVSQSGVGINVPYGTIKSPYVDEIPLGFVEFSLDTGEITYNGQKLTSQESANLRQSCQKILEK
jgi:hypothetical protein